MLISNTVKHIILLPIYFFLILCLASFLLVGLNILYIIGSYIATVPLITEDLVIALIPQSLFNMFLLAVLITIFMTLLWLKNKSKIRIVPYLFVMGISLLTLISGLYIITGFTQNEKYPLETVSPQVLSTEESAHKLIRFQDAFLYFDKVEGNKLMNFIIINNTQNTPDFHYYGEGIIEDTDGLLSINVVNSGSRKYTLKSKAEIASVFKADSLWQLLMENYNMLQSHYYELLKGSQPEFYIFSITLIFLAISANLFLRLSRWQLLNIFMYWFIMVLILFFYNFIIDYIVKEIIKIWEDLFFIRLIPYAILFVLALLFFLFDFLLLPQPRLERKKF